MKAIYRKIGIAIMALELMLTTGCINPDGTQNNTGSGALIGGVVGALAGAATGGRYAGQSMLIGAAIGTVSGALIGNMIDRDQRERLREQSPQTWATIQHNDTVVQQQQQAAQAPASAPAPPPTDTVTPITVDDVKALATAGVKPDAINQEIEVSKSTFSAQDIATAQQAGVDPSVINCMKSHAS